MKFENKVTLVTGGNFGIGYGIAKKFAEEGSEIAIVARNEERAKNVIKDLENQGFVEIMFIISNHLLVHIWSIILRLLIILI